MIVIGTFTVNLANLAVRVHLLNTIMKLETFECGVILFTISLCWVTALHPATKSTETLGDSQRDGSIAVDQEGQSCPTWYRAVKNNGVTRCVCKATLDHSAVCNEATLQTLIRAGYCMSYGYRINASVIGRCPYNYHHPDTQIVYITLPNDTSELNSFMCSGLNRTGLLCS